MRRILILVMVAFSMTMIIRAQDSARVEPLAVFLEGGLWHFINTEGIEMFPPIDIVEFGGYSEGLFRVKMFYQGKERWLFLDTTGNIAVVPECDEVMIFSDGLALAGKSNYPDTVYTYLFGFIDRTGKAITPYHYIDASYFNNGLAWARTKDTKGYIDKTGKYRFTNDTLIGNAFNEGTAAVNNFRYKMGFIDTTGNIVIGVNYDEVSVFSEGKAFFHNDGHGGYIDKKGNVIVKPKWDDGKPFSEGYAFVGGFYAEKMLLWGAIDSTGTLVIKLKYEAVRKFHEGIAAVAKDRSWGFIDSKGAYILPSQYGSAGTFFNGLAWASIPNKKYGFIDKSGNYIIEIPKPEKLFDLRMNEQVF